MVDVYLRTLIERVREYDVRGTGGSHACGVTVAGVVYCWGGNEFGQPGDGSRTNRLTPVPVMGGLTLRSVSAGTAHNCGISTNGDTYCWGLNNSGQLGAASGDTCSGLPCSTSPVKVGGGFAFESVSAGGSHVCGIAGGGELC